MTPPPPQKKKNVTRRKKEKKRNKLGGGGGGKKKWKQKKRGGGGDPHPPQCEKKKGRGKKGGEFFFMRVETKERKKEQKKKKKNRGEGKGCCHQRSPNNSHVLSTVHLCTQWKVTLHIAGHCHLAPTVHSDDSLMHVVKPLAQSSETAGAVTVCLPNNIQCMSSLGLRGCTEHWRWCLPGLRSQRMVRTLAGECTASLGWPSGGCGEPAQSHSVSVNEGVGPDREARDGAYTRRGVHGIPELTIGCVWRACSSI